MCRGFESLLRYHFSPLNSKCYGYVSAKASLHLSTNLDLYPRHTPVIRNVGGSYLCPHNWQAGQISVSEIFIVPSQVYDGSTEYQDGAVAMAAAICLANQATCEDDVLAVRVTE